MQNKARNTRSSNPVKVPLLGVRIRQSIQSLQGKSSDEISLHSLRVGLKQVVTLGEFLKYLPSEMHVADKDFAIFQGLQKKIADARDAQVQLKMFNKIKSRPGKMTEPFFQWLRLRTYKKNQKLETTLKNEDPREYAGLFNEMRNLIRSANKKIILAHANEFILLQTRHAEEFFPVFKDRFHIVRISIKKIHHLMFMLDMLDESLVKEFKLVEKSLGDSHDLQRGIVTIRGFLRKHKVAQVARKTLKKMSMEMGKKKKTELEKAQQKIIPLFKRLQDKVARNKMNRLTNKKRASD